MNNSEDKTLNDVYRRDRGFIYGVLLILLVFTGIAFYREWTPEWKRYQSGFKKVLGAKFGKAAEEKFEYEIKQIWLKDTNKIDRCITCHAGIDIEKLSGDEIPLVFRSHPQKGLIEKHPFKDFGCTFCHGGKGYALTVKESHYTGEKGWINVFLSKELARKYGFEDYEKMPLLEINCNACHVHEKEVKGLKYVNRGKKIFEEKMCTCCHNFYGKGGLVGPDLTYEGDKPADLYNFSTITDWKGLHPSIFSWHFMHFKTPYFVTLTTLMPNLNLKDEEIRSLIMLVLSYKRVPANLQPNISQQKKEINVSCQKGQ